MRKNAVILMAAAVLILGGCASTYDGMGGEAENTIAIDASIESSVKEPGDTAANMEGNTKEDTEEDSSQQSTAMSSEESGSVLPEEMSFEEVSSEESKQEVPKVEIDYDSLIDEREALDLAYNYLYADSVYSGYGVYSDEIYHQGVYRWGYVVVQFSYEEDSYLPKYEKYDPDVDLMIGKGGRLELLYDGLSSNELFYTFWLCDYIRDSEDWGHRSTLNFIAVSIDGKMIECERTDKEGNEKSIDEWDWYFELLQ